MDEFSADMRNTEESVGGRERVVWGNELGCSQIMVEFGMPDGCPGSHLRGTGGF